MIRKLVASACFTASLSLPLAVLGAEEEGRADFDEALRAKVTAEDLRDLNHVVELLESAIDKGLDLENSNFAEQMLSESLLERAEQLTAVLRHVPAEELTDRRMMQIRDLATSDLRRVLTYDNAPPQATVMLARLLTLPGGDRREARRLLDKLFKHAAVETLEPLERAESLVLRAALQSKPEPARADFDAAVELVPDNAGVRLARAAYLRTQDQLDAALADLAAVVDKHPDNAAAYLLRAQIEQAQKKWDAAQTSLAKASELAPMAASPIQSRGEIYRQQGELAKAIEQFSKVLDMQPGNLLALLHRAEAYLSNEQYDEALGDVDAAIREQPGLVVAHALRAQALANSDRVTEAIAEMEKLTAAVPAVDEYKMQLALYYLVANETQKAIAAYSDVITTDANNYLALRSRGDAYLNIGEHAPAVADFDRALPMKSDDPALLNNFAWVLATSPDDSVRNGARAIELATKACEVTEYKRPHILSTLAAAYAEVGDFESARKWSKQAVATRDPKDNDEAAKDMVEQLAKELASYEAGKPWRERQTAPPSPAESKAKDAPAKNAAKAKKTISPEAPKPDAVPPSASPDHTSRG